MAPSKRLVLIGCSGTLPLLVSEALTLLAGLFVRYYKGTDQLLGYTGLILFGMLVWYTLLCSTFWNLILLALLIIAKRKQQGIAAHTMTYLIAATAQVTIAMLLILIFG